MIYTPCGLRYAKREVRKFRRALKEWTPVPPEGVDPIIHAATKQAVEIQLQELLDEIEDYKRKGGG